MARTTTSQAPARNTPTCAEVMRRKVVCIEPGTTVARAARLMQENGCGFLPVVDREQRVVGVLTDRDIAVRVCAQGALPDTILVESVMSRDLVRCRPEDTLSTAEDRMIARHKWRILVLEDERLAGVLSITDIAQVEQPLKLAQLIRQVAARDIRLEHR